MTPSIWILSAALAAAAPDDPSTRKTILRLEPGGPAGVGLSGEGKSREYTYYQSESDERVSAGVWESEPFQSGPKRRKYSEFIYVLEGSVTLVDGAGREETFRAGDAAIIPRGTELTWKQPDRMRKYWVVFDWETPEEAAAPASGVTFARLEPNGPKGKLEGESRTRYHEYYSAKNDTNSTGVWETDPHTAEKPHRTKYAELMVFLEGSVTLVDGDGKEHHFKGGDVALVPKEIDYQWKGDYVKKYWVIFDP